MADSVIKVNLDMANATYNRKLRESQKATQTFAKSSAQDLQQLRMKYMGVAAAVGAFALGVKKILDITNKQVLAETQLNAVLRSTHHAAGMSAGGVMELASSLQSVTAYGDETIIQGQNLLLTFTKIGREVFPQATETMLNMSAALGQDLKQSAIQVGKALNDPVMGITALRRVGVQLSADQERQIRSFMAVNDIVSAQKVILGELETQFGGVARAMGDTAYGSMERLKNVSGDLVELFGRQLGPALKEIADNSVESASNMDTLAVKLGKVTAGYLSFFNNGGGSYLKQILMTGADFSGLSLVIKYNMKIGEWLNNTAEEARRLNERWQESRDDLSSLNSLTSDYIEVLKRYKNELMAIQTEYRNLGTVGTAFNQMIINTVARGSGGNRGGGAGSGGGGGSRGRRAPQVAESSSWAGRDDFTQQYLQMKATLDEYYNYKLQWDDYVLMRERENQEKARAMYEQTIRSKLAMDSMYYSGLKMITNMGMALMQSSNKKIFRLGQALAIANTFINSAEAIIKGFSYGPFIGIPYAALVTAATGVQLAQIRKQKPPEMAVGTWEVPRDMNANIHRGEQIIPAPMAEAVRSGEAALVGGGGGQAQPLIFQIDGHTVFAINDIYRSKRARAMGARNYTTQSAY